MATGRRNSLVDRHYLIILLIFDETHIAWLGSTPNAMWVENRLSPSGRSPRIPTS
jgi:hypothetical protein